MLYETVSLCRQPESARNLRSRTSGPAARATAPRQNRNPALTLPGFSAMLLIGGVAGEAAVDAET
jgi:hypothetical protein